MYRQPEAQTNFFDLAIFQKMIPQDHPLVKIAQAVDFSFVEDETKHLYTADNGRPGFSPEILFRVLLLEIWANLSDVQVCRELQYNILYRWFCRLGWDDKVPDDTTLVVFRKRLGEDSFQAMMSRIVQQAQSKGLLKGHWLLIDGTSLHAHAQAESRVNLLRESRKRLAILLAKENPERQTELLTLAQPLNDQDYSDQKALLEAEEEKTQSFLRETEKLSLSEDAKERKEECQQAVTGELASLSDPDARWGYTRKDKAFLGYKAHVAADEAGFVTAVTVSPANTTEQSQLPKLLEETLQRGIKPDNLVADKGYDASALRTFVQEKGIRPYIASRIKRGRLLEQGFSYDNRSEELVCPAGKKAIGWHAHKNGGRNYYYSEKDCKNCEYRQSCLTPSQSRKLVYVYTETEQNRPKGMKIALRIRKGIERTFGNAKVWHRMNRARYRGLKGVTIQVLLTLMVVNLKKMVAMLAGKNRRSVQHSLFYPIT